MNSLITPIVLIALSIGLFFTVTDGQYSKVKDFQATNASYETAIENSKKLLATRDKLLAQYNTFPATDLARLEKLLPDNIDNVRLIIDINGITSKYGVPVQDIKVDTLKSTTGNTTTASPLPTVADNKPYRSATLTFSITASYDTFLLILKDLESSLRILDVNNVTFDSTLGEPYKYSITVQTYWMK